VESAQEIPVAWTNLFGLKVKTWKEIIPIAPAVVIGPPARSGFLD